MTREQAKQNLISIGIAEPTDEQVTNYLNQVGGETKKEKDRADRMKADADKVAELQKQLDELNNANLTEIEKANKATESEKSKVAELEKQIKAMRIENELAKLGISENIFNENGEVDFAVLGTVISNKEKQAVADFEKKSLDGTPNPDGQGGSHDDGKSNAEKVAEKVTLALGDSKATSDIVNAYA